MTLTASHFLLYSAPASYPEDPRLPARPDLLTKWNHCQAVVQHFWQRWSREYLQQLQARSRWQAKSPNLEVGDIVIMKPEKAFKCHWPLARITEVFPGQDGLVRVVSLKTATGGQWSSSLSYIDPTSPLSREDVQTPCIQRTRPSLFQLSDT